MNLVKGTAAEPELRAAFGNSTVCLLEQNRSEEELLIYTIHPVRSHQG